MPSKKQKLKQSRYNSIVEVGSWKSLPHYAVVGRATDFYLFHHRDANFARSTVWITGVEAFELHAKFKELRIRSKTEFVKLFLEEFNKREKM